MRILICDDQAIIRDGLRMLLSPESDMEVVGAACDGAQAVALHAELAPDLVLMDLKMPGMNGVEATRQIRARSATTRVLVLTTYDGDSWVFDAIRAGAAGYLLKDTPRDDLIKAIRGTMAGKAYVDPAVADKLLNQVAQTPGYSPNQITDRLTEREIDVLRLIAAGLNNAAIADRLNISDGTARNHVSSILAKLGVPDRTQAAVLALRYGIK